MKFATYNVEWFNTLFDDAGRLINDGTWSSRWSVTKAQQTAALGTVFQTMDLDAVMIVEAPDTSRHRDGTVALETFAKTFNLRARKAIIGFDNDTQQEIAFLYDPDLMDAKHAPLGDPVGKKGSRDAPRFDGAFKLDLDIDATPDVITWSKPPLEVAVTTKTGQVLHLIGVHAKSKPPMGPIATLKPPAFRSRTGANSSRNVSGCANALTGICSVAKT